MHYVVVALKVVMIVINIALRAMLITISLNIVRIVLRKVVSLVIITLILSKEDTCRVMNDVLVVRMVVM
jgi:hypothetical protein